MGIFVLAGMMLRMVAIAIDARSKSRVFSFSFVLHGASRYRGVILTEPRPQVMPPAVV